MKKKLFLTFLLTGTIGLGLISRPIEKTNAEVSNLMLDEELLNLGTFGTPSFDYLGGNQYQYEYSWILPDTLDNYYDWFPYGSFHLLIPHGFTYFNGVSYYPEHPHFLNYSYGTIHFTDTLANTYSIGGVTGIYSYNQSINIISAGYDPLLDGAIGDISVLIFRFYVTFPTVLDNYATFLDDARIMNTQGLMRYINMLVYGDAHSDGYTAGDSAGKVIGYNSGLTDGYNSGLTDGYNSGVINGYNSGFTDGYNSGLNEIDAYGKGYDDGARDKFMANFDKWIVPAIIVIMFLGGFISIMSMRSNKG